MINYKVMNLKIDELDVKVLDNRKLMGEKAGKDVIDRIHDLLNKQNEVSIIFAAAPSQKELYEALINSDVDWSRVNAFHMDEYVGLSVDSPQSFRRYLKDNFFDKLSFNSIHLIEGDSIEVEKECRRYENLLNKFNPDIVCLGIGENCHIAFNDPPVADFNDTVLVKQVLLDEACRNQQVNDGCFPTFNEVPKEALTLTIPAIFRAKYLYCVVPGPTKSQAIFNTLKADISEKFPSTILRKHTNAVLYLDRDSASLISKS